MIKRIFTICLLAILSLIVLTTYAQTRVVYLPEGTWFDYWTGQQYEGEQYVSVLSPLDTIPIFAKGGAIIPMQEEVQYITDYPANLMLDIYPHGESSFTLYEDDGKSLEYQEGNYATTEISCSAEEGQISILIGEPEGGYEVPDRSYVLKVHSTEVPQTVSVANQKLQQLSNTEGSSDMAEGWYYDQEQEVVFISTESKKDQEILINIRYQ